MAVESVQAVKRNGDLIAEVAKLWMKPEYTVVDITSGNQKWWTKFRPEDLICHDLDPEKGDGVDFRALPEEDGSVDVVVFDPPFVSVGGRKTSTITGMLESYGLVHAPNTPAGVDDLIYEGITEAARIVRTGGFLWLKCMSYISSGKFHQGHNIAVNNALFDGYWTQVDEFIHHSGPGPQPTTNLDGTPRRQVHSRNVHSFLCIFQRTKKRVRDVRRVPLEGGSGYCSSRGHGW
jgi:hypothetical protein